MNLDETLLARDGIEDLRDAMADVITNDIADEQARQEYAYDRIDQIEPVGARDGEMMGQQVLNLMDEPFQQQARQSREDTNDQGKRQHEPVALKMRTLPSD